MSLRGIPVAEILEAVGEAREKGWTITRQVWIEHGAKGEPTCCCPLGACLVARGAGDSLPDEPDYANVADELGVDHAWAEGFVDGFDGNKVAPSSRASRDIEAYELGYRAGADVYESLNPKPAVSP